MIVNLRGTSGAGKSTIVTSVMERYTMAPQYKEGRKRPYFYLGSTADLSKQVAILGHYEIACGGCDTIKTVQEVYDLVRGLHDKGWHILYEGIMVAEAAIQGQIDFARSFGPAYLVIGLTTPLPVCVEGIKARRLAKGDDKPLDETNTRNRIVRIQRNLDKLSGAGIRVLRLSREEALAATLSALGWPA